MYHIRISYSAQIFSKFFQYFIVGVTLIDTITNNSTGFNKSKINFSIKIGYPFHPHNFHHMDVVVFYIVFISHRTEEVYNPTNITQHLYIRMLEVIILPTNLVNIFYGYFVHPLTQIPFTISRELRYICIKVIIYDIISVFLNNKTP